MMAPQAILRPGRARVLLSISLLSLLAIGPLIRSAEAGSTVLRPVALGGSLFAGWHKNVLGASRAEQDAFANGDPGYFFVVDRLNDWVIGGEAWARWNLPSVYRTVRLDLGVQQREWAGLSILGWDRFDLDLKQKLPARSAFRFRMGYEPQVYLRHRRDKDAGFGQPAFRPEAYRGLDLEARYQRPLAGDLNLTLLVNYESRNETKWFEERSRKRRGAGLEIVIPLGGSASVKPGYEYGRIRSRNRPDLGSDQSSREHVPSMRLKFESRILGEPLTLDAGGKMKFRSYTTDNRDDASRYHRRDRSYYWSVKLSRPSPPLSPFLKVERDGRAINVPLKPDSANEDGAYNALKIWAGVDWELQL
jgi:hypothetical protein